MPFFHHFCYYTQNICLCTFIILVNPRRMYSYLYHLFCQCKCARNTYYPNILSENNFEIAGALSLLSFTTACCQYLEVTSFPHFSPQLTASWLCSIMIKAFFCHRVRKSWAHCIPHTTWAKSTSHCNNRVTDLTACLLGPRKVTLALSAHTKISCVFTFKVPQRISWLDFFLPGIAFEMCEGAHKQTKRHHYYRNMWRIYSTQSCGISCAHWAAVHTSQQRG